MNHLDWQHRAACKGRDLALFFGAESERQPYKDQRETAAVAVCWTCQVRPECLTYALRVNAKYGIYGGMTEDERANERRRLQRRGELAPEAA